MIALEDVAPDARAMARAFRDAGSPSFRDVGVTGARAAYTASCQGAGPPPSDTTESHELTIGGVPCRAYRNKGDAFLPPGPTLLFLHGGGWVIGDLDSHDLVCREFARTTGARVVAVHYRRAPEHPFPAAHDDAIAVAAALLDDGAGLADPKRVVLVGDSAGGNLAAWVAAEAARGRFANRPRAQVLFYPVADLTGSYPSYERVVEGFPLTADTMRWFAEQYTPDPSSRRDPRVSPLLHSIAPGQPAAFICTVHLDPLADEGIAYASALASAGTAVEHHHLPGYAHGLVTSAGRISTGQSILHRAAVFARSFLE